MLSTTPPRGSAPTSRVVAVAGERSGRQVGPASSLGASQPALQVQVCGGADACRAVRAAKGGRSRRPWPRGGGGGGPLGVGERGALGTVGAVLLALDVDLG